MKDIISKLRHGGIVQIITPTKQREQIQLNRKETSICWERFTMAINGDKSCAIKLDSKLTLRQVVAIIRYNLELLKTADL